MPDKINVGDSLTDLPGYSKKLPSNDGEERSLSQYNGEKSVVLFFFPRAASTGCTKEVCSFRDSYNEFQSAGAQVIGISSDSPAALSDFAKAQRAQYPFLSDANGELRKELGVQGNLLGFVPGRETFVISKEGVVLLRFNDGLHFNKHVQEALKCIQKQ
ncbi:hypothetical protein WJX73_006940 [Symbiochloris irregularis]|uniref:thioredoxin-dependent peroxiredoxin n=1 Tax=Symbiochloris irregularis TaxID=706552 RepID=A0AAW1NUZ1_9CHLO